ncbi:MAG TPA: hypothetical protein VJI68_00020 [Candidatus Nanoarchaeia archaeon]|nr:hypothetical protein [Candidatus Nanoarchaeia archaeon]
MPSPDYNEIKAGVEGDIGDVPSPSADEVNSSHSDPEYEDVTLPTTHYSDPNESNFSYGAVRDSSAPPENYSNSSSTSSNPQIDTEWLHQVIESIISEKWDDSMSKMGDISLWKERINTEIVSIKQEVMRISERFDQLQGAVLGRVKESDEGIKGIHTEMRALEKVFEKILEPLTSNIKELNKITEDLKKHKKN